jgi:hypothetical protein
MKESSFHFRIDPALKAAFSAAAEAEDKPAAQILRTFMRLYVQQRQRHAFAAEADRQSRAIAARADIPGNDEYSVMREIEAELDRDDFAESWTS